MKLKKTYLADNFPQTTPQIADTPLPPDASPPMWRKAFSLNENVRFTRTPDIEFIRKHAATDEAAAARLRALVTTKSHKHLTRQQSQPIFERDIMPQVTPVLASNEDFSKDFPHETATGNVATHLTSLISDFAYFDCGVEFLQKSQTHSNNLDAPTESEPAGSAQKPIAALFNELECRFAKTDQGEAQEDKQPQAQPSPCLEISLANFAQHYRMIPTVQFTSAGLDGTTTIQFMPSSLHVSSSISHAQEFPCEQTQREEPQHQLSATKTEQIAEISSIQTGEMAQKADITPALPEPTTITKNVMITPRATRPLPSTDLGKGLRPAELVDDYAFPDLTLLQPPIYQDGAIISQETLERSAGLLENVLEDFGIRGEIIHVRPGPVVTLYEFEPAPGVKSSRIIGLSDDIARSMSAISARVAVIPGRNVIGIELPNMVRETVFLREIVQSHAYLETDFKLPLALGKNIGGEPVIAELAKMPHLLVAGTTGSGKSVAINTMILSLLYRLTPDQCRLIMVDPKMLELSIYDGIPHLLTPVVTDPKKAVTALKWAVREMEDRYRKMAKLGVRNIDGFNARVVEAQTAGEAITCTVQAGFDKETGELLYHEEAMDLTPLPYIVIIVDEMADLMMVAGKEIEGAIQRLAQMARAAGIHLIMATQRPSVDVITGTIKANFPTRISFQVTSKIDSRTILGEQGAETLLGQGDMLHMAGGGRIVRVHGAFVSDGEVENIVAHLKTQGKPDYLATVTSDNDEEDETEDETAKMADLVANIGEDSEELYLQAVKVVMRDKKCSTSYIQRRLGIGYNKAASLVERMEGEGLVGAANHVGKREILNINRSKIEEA